MSAGGPVAELLMGGLGVAWAATHLVQGLADEERRAERRLGLGVLEPATEPMPELVPATVEAPAVRPVLVRLYPPPVPRAVMA